MPGLYIGLWVVAVIILVLFTTYNKIVSLKNNRDNAFADIDTQLQLRFDLIPNLVNTVKGYAKHEKETLENVIKARSNYTSASGVDGKIAASNMLTQTLGKLFALSEAYPDLKANTNFLQMQTELSDIENKLAAARRFFNSATTEYNTFIQMVPNNIIAGMFNFRKADMFEITNPEAKESPKVTF